MRNGTNWSQWSKQWKPWLGAGCVGMAVLASTGCGRGPGDGAMDEYERQERAEAEARAKDPAWTASHTEVAVFRLAQGGERTLNNFCLDPEGNVLACVGGGNGGTKHAIEVCAADGKVKASWPMDTEPQAICLAPDGSILVGGAGRLTRFDRSGKVLKSAPTPSAGAPPPAEEDVKALAKRYGDGPEAERLNSVRERLASRRLEVTGLAATGEDVFVATPSAKDWSFTVYRVDRDFGQPKPIVEKLSGCCGQMDIQARQGQLWIAHNGRHRVECHDRDGKLLASFGKRDRQAADGFGGCCEPKNVRLLEDGNLLAGESGPPVAVKRFTADGKFLGVVALPAFDLGCVRTTVDVSPDGRRYHVLNPSARTIHVFAAKP